MLNSERTVLEDVIEGPTIQAGGYAIHVLYIVSTYHRMYCRPTNLKIEYITYTGHTGHTL